MKQSSNQELKKIPSTFKKNGYFYELIERTGDFVVFSQSKPQGIVKGFEVHKVRRIQKRTVKDGHWVIDKECFVEMLASNEQFGVYGWSYNTLENARNKVSQLKVERMNKITRSTGK